MILSYSCKKDTEGVSKITNYVTFDPKGGSLVTFAKGSYVAPTYVAKEGTKDVTSSVVVNSTVNGNKVGLYTIKYSAVNTQGFSSSSEQTVIIYDPAAPATDIGGTFKAGVVRGANTYSGLNVSINKLAPGFFYVDDFLGGYYAQGRNYANLYGPGYNVEGYIQLNADNTLTLVSSSSSAWGTPLTSMANGVYTPATKGIYWEAIWSGYTFKVTLVKQ